MENNYTSTLGFEYFSLNYQIKKKTIKVKIWDTCGQEIYRSLFSNFYRGTTLALIVFSLDE